MSVSVQETLDAKQLIETAFTHEQVALLQRVAVAGLLFGEANPDDTLEKAYEQGYEDAIEECRDAIPSGFYGQNPYSVKVPK